MMLSRSIAGGFALLLLACAPAAPGDSGGSPMAETAGNPTATPTLAPAVRQASPDLRQMVDAQHGDQAPWSFLESEAITGGGPCATTTLGAVIDVIRAGVPAVSAINEFRSTGPRGVVMNAGPPMRAGDPVAPATGTASYVVGFMDERSFGIAFFAGQRCRGDSCEEQQHWYFETDDQCRPRWVGHLLTVAHEGGAHGTCVDVEGQSLWSTPGQPDVRSRCDADWSAQDISGTRPALILDPTSACDGQAAEDFAAAEITITQAADLSRGTLVVRGTGLGALDGKVLAGTVERQAFRGTIEETVPGACPVARTFRFDFDFEQANAFGLPGGFGILDITDQPVGSCTPGPNACRASVHFMRKP